MADTAAEISPAQQITQLQNARKLALQDPTHYTKLIPALLPHYGPSAPLELRRWVTDLAAEGLACPTLALEHKQTIALASSKTLRAYLEAPSEDAAVVKSVIHAATSAYPLIFRHIIYNSDNSTSWQDLSAIKSNILKRETLAPAGIKVCCVKFIQRVVQVQTPGLIADPRRPDENELSLALVPNEHAVLSPSHLQAEAFGLLDRMLNVFQDPAPSDALLVTATLNSVGVLVRTRPSIANRILNAVMNLNPFKGAGPNASSSIKIVVKSMEKTIRAFLLNVNKRNPSHPMAGRIMGYLDHMSQLRAEVFEERGRKRSRSPLIEPTDGLDNAKRRRLDAELLNDNPRQHAIASLPPDGSCTMAQMFTLTNDDRLRGFDARFFPPHLIANYAYAVLHIADAPRLFNAIEDVRARWQHLQTSKPHSALDAARDAAGVIDDDEEYQPDDTEAQVFSQIEKSSPPLPIVPPPPTVNLGPFIIPQPPPLSHDDVVQYGKGTVTRVFGAVDELQEPPSKAAKSGFNRVAASTYDRESWITIVSRLATRSLSGLDMEADVDAVKKEGADTSVAINGFSISDTLRESMFRYVLDDWRKRLDIAVTWLNEEWYNERVSSEGDKVARRNYEKWALKVFDGILPYLDAKDKVLIRFLSEIPEVTESIIERTKRLARDPERVQLAVQAIYYLVLYRPPAREMCIDALEDLYNNYDDAKTSTAKFLKKWRPSVLETKPEPAVEKDAKLTTSAETVVPIAA